MKASLVKLITLEQQLASERAERLKLEQEYSKEKEKYACELKVFILIKSKYINIWSALKNSSIFFYDAFLNWS